MWTFVPILTAMRRFDRIDWRRLNSLFTALMWTLAVMLAMFVLYEVLPQTAATPRHVILAR